MEERTKRRLVGAAVLVSVFVIVTPMVLDHSGSPPPRVRTTDLPPPPAGAFPGHLADRWQAPPELSEPAPEDLFEPVPFEEPPPGAEGPSEPAVLEQGSGSAVSAPGGAGEDVPAEADASPAREESPPAEGAVPETRVGLSAWAVQLSSHANAANAIALRNALRGRGFVAFVESTPEGTTRVCVGPELKREQAVAAQQRLARVLGIKGTVVPYPGRPSP